MARIPVSVSGPGVNAQPPNISLASNHVNTAYLNSQQQAVVMKQHQMLLDQQKQREQQQQKHLLMEHQKQFMMGQRQLLAEQVRTLVWEVMAFSFWASLSYNGTEVVQTE